jgi:hypothetical protein
MSDLTPNEDSHRVNDYAVHALHALYDNVTIDLGLTPEERVDMTLASVALVARRVVQRWSDEHEDAIDDFARTFMLAVATVVGLVIAS